MLRSAYFPKRVHRTLFSKTLDLQPLCGLRKGAEEGTTPQSAAADSSPYTGEPRKGNPSVRCGGQLPLHRGAEGRGTPQSAAADSSPYMLQPQAACEGGAEEGATPQSAAADSSPYILRTEIAFQAIPVLRMAYFTKRPYYGLFVKTHMLQPQAACEGGSRRRGQPVSLGAMRMRMKKGGG